MRFMPYLKRLNSSVNKVIKLFKWQKRAWPMTKCDLSIQSKILTDQSYDFP